MSSSSDAPCAPDELQPHDSAKVCFFCGAKFGMTTWRYSCHMCGEVCCDNCTKHKLTLPPHWIKEPVRVCDLCMKSGAATSIGKTKGGGRVLGTGGGTGGDGTGGGRSAEEERQFRANLVQARLQGGRPNSGSASSRPKPPPPTTTTQTSTSQQPQQQSSSPQQQQQKSNSCGGDDAAAAETNPMLAAAMRRRQQQGGGGGSGGGRTAASSSASGGASDHPQQQQQSGSSGNSEEKRELLRQIQDSLRSRHEDEPFGLRAMDETKLRMYLRDLRSRK